jgi:hypothetical protein
MTVLLQLIACSHIYFTSLQALMLLDHPYLYGSINLFDQYRDMRLDVDSMSYEVSIFRK